MTDAISLHDYEGHESIVPEHWTWKFAEIRKIMTQYGDGDKPIWQTERAIEGVRGNNFQGLVQAIRCNLHESLLETLGVPPEHDFHFYLTEHGFSSVPSYVWSGNGPHPAALCLRTRYALTGALGRQYAGKFDFGPTGNTLFLGLQYAGSDGQTFVLSNLGTMLINVPFALSGADTIAVSDAWGNAQVFRAQNGHVTLPLTQLPIFVMLKPGQTLASPKIDFGHNIAAEASWSYSDKVENGDFSILTNGIYETYNDADPNGSTDGAKIWTGALPLVPDHTVQPQTLTATFEKPHKIDHVIIRGVCADNTFCALLDYDLEYSDGQKWITLQQIRDSMPRSEALKTADAVGAVWMDNTNLYCHQFPAIETRSIRIKVYDVSRGMVPDDAATVWGNHLACKLMLKEVEIYSPQAN